MKCWISVASAVIVLVAGSLPVGAATFTGVLSGAAEEDPNNSPGTGPVEVELDPAGHMLRVDVSFSGLVSPSAIAHIHCCAPPGVSAGVATTTPTFPGFPASVTSGSYQMTLDTTAAATFNPAFISANGGTPESAEAALLAGLTSGMAYFNIHTMMFGAGEVRADLTGIEPGTPSATVASATPTPTPPATPATFTGTFSGAAEDPPNDSSGTGTAEVELDPVEHVLRVDVTFSGLGSPSTIAHIHCCAPPGEGANVATTVPTFQGFPAGVMSGTYQMTFDTTQASTFNPAFISANGGTPAGAEAALLAGLTSGMAYFNIHTMTFQAGEIRADLVAGSPATPTATVSAATATATLAGATATLTVPAGTATATITVTPTAAAGTATVTGQPTSTPTVMGPTTATATSGPSGTPTTGTGSPTVTVGTMVSTATVTPSRAATGVATLTPAPSTEDDGCSILARPQRGAGGAWLLSIPAALLLLARRRRR